MTKVVYPGFRQTLIFSVAVRYNRALLTVGLSQLLLQSRLLSRRPVTRIALRLSVRPYPVRTVLHQER